ncbi:MAG: hypothetical protein H6737_28450 [Alphaproteobacteria bacterium]|nr:hypothetical protein [Alphaproteobacteria bacterium]
MTRIPLLALLVGCTLVPRRQVERLLDADGDHWLADVDCNSADPTLGGAEKLDDAIDNDCDGHALIDLRNWPTDDSACWIGSAGTVYNPALLGEGSYVDPSTGASIPADLVVSAAEVEGDGIPELVSVSGSDVTWRPTAGDAATWPVPGDASTTAWGGMVEGCPTVLVAGVDDVQPSWIAVRRIDLCNGTVRAKWTFASSDRRLADVHALDLGTDIWPDTVVAQPYRDVPTVGIQYRQQPDVPEAHDHLDVRLRGAAPPFGEYVASGDMNGDNVEELLISGADGAWLVRGANRPGVSDVVQDMRIEDIAIALPSGPVSGLAFKDLDLDGSTEALVATSTEHGVQIHAYDDRGNEVALLVAPPGPCEVDALGDLVLISGGTAYFLP